MAVRVHWHVVRGRAVIGMTDRWMTLAAGEWG